MNRILIIDGTYYFIKSFEVMNYVNDAGIFMGGIVGIINSIYYIEKTLNKFNQILIVFDGINGNNKRKLIFEHYKSNRNYFERVGFFETSEKKIQSYNFQMKRVINYLNILGLRYIITKTIESDDLIAHSVDIIKKNISDYYVVIASNDSDFFQLLDDNIYLYRQKRSKDKFVENYLYSKTDFIYEYKMHPHNYILNKAIVGDTADNINGIKGIGKKRMNAINKIIFNNENEILSLSEFYDRLNLNKDKNKYILDILNNWNIVERNYKLMILGEKSHIKISKIVQDKLLKIFLSNRRPINYNKLEMMMRVDGISNLIKYRF